MKKVRLLILALLLTVGIMLTGCEEEQAPKATDSQGTESQSTETQSTEAKPTEPEVLEANYFVLEKASRFDADGELISSCTVELNEEGLPKTVTEDIQDAETGMLSKLRYDEDGNLCSIITTEETEEYDIEFQRIFDEHGNLLEEIYYSDGEELSCYEYEYDENGNCTAAMISLFFSGEMRWEFEYDESGNRVKSTFFHDNRIDTSLYEFDEQGNLIKDTGYVNDQESSRTEYSYDEKGNLLAKIEFDEEKETGREEYEYDEQGNLLKKAVIYNGKETQTYLYEYDRDGKLLKETTLEDGAVEEIYEYDKDGNLLNAIRYAEGEISYQAKYVYNDRGRVLEVAKWMDDEVTRTVYEYDENSLCIKETIYIDDVLEEYTTYTWYEDNGFIKDKNVELIRALFSQMSAPPDIFTEK